MKKLLVILAIGTLAACGNSQTPTEKAAETAVDAAKDAGSALVDSAKNAATATVDSAKAAANATVDSAKAKLDSLKK